VSPPARPADHDLCRSRAWKPVPSSTTREAVKIPGLVPSQGDDYDVHPGEDEPPGRVGKVDAVALIQDKVSLPTGHYCAPLEQAIANWTLTLGCYLASRVAIHVSCQENEMRRLSILFSTLAFTALTANAFTGQKYAHEAKVTMREARAIALKAFPGRIVDEELEREKGGSGLRYSFDIRKGKSTQEVGVDAKTGAVLENDREGAHPD
jgi:Peptidase propeptide and YPEB domain